MSTKIEQLEGSGELLHMVAGYLHRLSYAVEKGPLHEEDSDHLQSMLGHLDCTRKDLMDNECRPGGSFGDVHQAYSMACAAECETDPRLRSAQLTMAAYSARRAAEGIRRVVRVNRARQAG